MNTFMAKEIIVESDHKPLKSILNTPIHYPPLRVQRFIMFLQNYGFVINYGLGKELICCSILSRAHLKEQTPEIPKTEVNFQVHSAISNFPISTETLKQLEIETLSGKTL